MTTKPTSFRSRVLPLLCVFFGTPVLAEYLQAYLSSTGDAAIMLGGLLVLGPLYGGAALLVREVAVRRGLGWRGVLLLGAAWGVLMPGVIDLALFGAHRDDVGYWDALREPTLVEPLGIGVFNTVTWVSGHVLFSIFAPLGLLHALAPAHRGRRCWVASDWSSCPCCCWSPRRSSTPTVAGSTTTPPRPPRCSPSSPWWSPWARRR